MSRELETQAFAVALILVVVVAAALGRNLIVASSASADGTPGVKTPPPRRVMVIAPERRTIRRVVRLSAEIVPWQDATISPRVTGYVKSISVDVGSRVAADAPIAVLDVPDLEAALQVAASRSIEASARVTEAKATLESARATARQAAAETGAARSRGDRVGAERERAAAEHAYRVTARDRLESVVAASPQLVPQETVDEARGKAAMAKASVAVAEAQIAESRALVTLDEAREEAAKTLVVAADAGLQAVKGAELAARVGVVQAEKALGFATLRAPFAGIVTERSVDPGDLVRGASGSERGAAVVRVIDTSKVRVRCRVAEPDSAATRLGSAFRLVVDALAGREFRGEVARVSEALAVETRTMMLEGDIGNADGALRAGMFGRVFLDLEPHENALVIPAEALTTVKRKSSVFVVLDGKVVKRAVKIGADDGIAVEVIDGLKDGESVVTIGRDLVAEGDRVEAVPEAKR